MGKGNGVTGFNQVGGRFHVRVILVIGIDCNLFPGRWDVAKTSGKAGAAPCIQKHGAPARRSERKKSLLNIGRNECVTLAGWPKSTPRPATHRQQRKLTSTNDDLKDWLATGTKNIAPSLICFGNHEVRVRQ